MAAIGTTLAVLIGALAFVTFRGGGLSSVPADSVAAIDASSGAVESTVSVRRRPVGMATARDGVWVANSIDRSITRIQPGGQTDTIPVGPGPIALAAGGDFMWVANGDASNVSRVSRTTQSVVGDPIQAGNGLSSVAYLEGPQPGGGDDSLWLGNSVDGSVWRVEPASGRKTLEVQVGPGLRDVVAAGNAIWAVSERAGTLTRIDPRNGVILRVVQVGEGPVALAIGEGAVWVANASDGTVTRVDATDYTTSTHSVGRRPRAIALAGGRVFVANEEDESVSMLDGDGKLVRTIELRNAPMGLTAQGDRVWVSVRGGVLNYRGGTLRLGTEVPIDTLDPSFAVEPTVSIFLAPLVYDGLTAFKRVGGPEGNQLVPNLAEEIRPPTDNGLTYTYTLRKGVRYSDGTPVRASDVRKTFERIMRAEAYGGAFVTVIKGTEGCTTPQACDLSSGIVTDDEAGSIVFHLKEPIADFPYQLALPSLSILPGNTAEGDREMAPIPGTGPYRIASVDVMPPAGGRPAQTKLVLDRNTRFEPRDLAQPDGFADRIEFAFGTPVPQLVAAVKAGDLDVVQEFAEAGPLSADQIGVEFPAQFHLIDMPWNALVALNTTIPPFNKKEARQAFAYALDRRRMARATDDLLGDISCQLLPKNTIGYVPYCPYTVEPDDRNIWKGPDLEKARELVAKSGTAGQRIVVYTEAGEGFSAFQRARRAPIVADALNKLGYRTEVREWQGDYFEGLIGGNFQIALTGWISDYPAASNFVLPLVTCDATLQRLGIKSVFTFNMAKFCDPDIDALTEQALKAQQDDPGASLEAWAKVDKAIADAAPYVPVGNLRMAAFVSRRVGNVQGHATYSLLLSQMWVTEPGSPSPTPSG